MIFSVLSIAVSVLIGATAVLVGAWGRRHAARLVPSTLPADERARRERVLSRGGWACQIVGALFAAAGVLTTLW
jgi:hypothetical protein